ncbi:MAG: protein translocase subunit SecDF [Bacteroidales bacterium]
MQNKGVIKFFAITFALICLFQLSFTFFARRVDNKAIAYATSKATVEQAKALAMGNPIKEKYFYDSLVKGKQQYFLDSVGNNVIYNILIRKYTYKDCKSRELNLGLDLRGGMNVLMEVSTSDVVKALSGYSADPFFNKVMTEAIARNKVQPNSNFVSIFETVWNEQDSKAQMASIFSFEMKDVNANSSNKEVIEAISKETSSAYERTYQILRQRIDKFGVAQPNIQKLTQTERILIELPGVKEPERVRKLLQGTAQLEFWETYEFSEMVPFLQAANEYLVSLDNLSSSADGRDGEIIDSTLTALADGTQPLVDTNSVSKTKDTSNKGDNALLEQLNKVEDSNGADALDAEQWKTKNPLFAVLMPSIYQGDEARKGPVVGYAQQKDIKRVDYLLSLCKGKFPRNAKLVWSVKPIQPNTDIYALVALKITTRDGRAPMGGDVITDARQDYDQRGGVEISMSMNTDGARIWKNLTGNNIGRSLAIVMDNAAYSWPTVNGEIPGGRSSITGGFSVEEGKDLANVLKAGKLPAPANIVQEAIVGPSLGQESITNSMISFVLAFLMVLIYMYVFYNRAGLVANIALLVNVFFLFGVLTSLGAVLTLSGIAGIVLTLGMAVDANVIIYERIKEELRMGKGVRLAVEDGYKNAYSAIIDGNVTTLITGIVLLYFGTGPIQGFATTLCIGILTSLFTAIFISRLIFEWWFSRNRKMTFSNKFSSNFLANTHIDFIGKRKISYLVSGIVVSLCIVSLCTRGLSLGIDFSGGRSYVVRFDKVVPTNELRSSLTAAFDHDAPEVKTFGPSNQVKITTKYKIKESGSAIDQDVETRLFEGCKHFFVEPMTLEEFRSENGDKLLGKLSSEVVGASVAADITRSAFIAVLISLIFIFGYIAIRFKKWQFGLGCLISLTHNTIISVGLFSLFYGLLPFSLDIDQAFIAAILTIIGYSVNDTVIVFDRIRENLSLYPKHSLKDNMNSAMNSTLPRTINTSGTTIITLLMIFIFGGEVIRGFTFSILCGIIIGTYSSIFVASPIAFDFLSRILKKKDEKLALNTKK